MTGLFYLIASFALGVFGLAIYRELKKAPHYNPMPPKKLWKQH